MRASSPTCPCSYPSVSSRSKTVTLLQKSIYSTDWNLTAKKRSHLEECHEGPASALVSNYGDYISLFPRSYSHPLQYSVHQAQPQEKSQGAKMATLGLSTLSEHLEGTNTIARIHWLQDQTYVQEKERKRVSLV